MTMQGIKTSQLCGIDLQNYKEMRLTQLQSDTKVYK